MNRQTSSPVPASPSAGRPPSAFLQALGLRSMVVALVLGVLAAVLLRPIFMVPFTTVLGRTLFLAALLLLVYAAARQWVPRWLPGWLPAWAWPVVPVAVSALPGTLLVYLLTLKGDFAAMLMPSASGASCSSPAAAWGWGCWRPSRPG